MREQLDNQTDSTKSYRIDPVAAEAKRLIRNDSHLTMQRIWCEFREGRLYLRGQVPSFYLKQLAQTAVAGMADVRQVVNEIEVVW